MLSSTHPTTAEFTEAAEVNLNEKSLGVGRLAGGEIHRGNPAWFITRMGGAGYNGVVKAVFPADGIDDCIEETLQPFLDCNLPLTWWTGPSSRPANLGARLQAHGLVHNRDMMGMAAEIDALKSPYETLPALRIEEVNDLQTLAEWHPLYMKGFSIPQANARDSLDSMGKMAFLPGSGWKHYYLRSAGQTGGQTGGRITAVGSIFTYEDVAGLYNLVTDPEERGQGIGAAMTLGLFAIAREQGCRIATLQTTFPNALRLYHRLGFEVYCKFGIYQLLSHSA